MESESVENSENGEGHENDVSSLFLSTETVNDNKRFTSLAEIINKNALNRKNKQLITEKSENLAKRDTAVYNSDFQNLRERMKLLCRK